MWLRAPLVPVALAFAAGIAVAGSIPIRWLWPASLAALALGALALALRRATIAPALVLLGVAAIGALRATPLPLAADHVAHLALPRSVTMTVRLDREPTVFAAERRRLDVAAESVDGTGRSGRL